MNYPIPEGRDVSKAELYVWEGEHTIEVSEPNFQAAHESTPDFLYVARCACGSHSDPSAKRHEVVEWGKQHTADAE